MKELRNLFLSSLPRSLHFPVQGREGLPSWSVDFFFQLYLHCWSVKTKDDEFFSMLVCTFVDKELLVLWFGWKVLSAAVQSCGIYMPRGLKPFFCSEPVRVTHYLDTP